MQVDISLQNYRCFPDSHPARLAIRKGFTALVGTNNSGKSSLLKFFYEFRHLLSLLSSPSSELLAILRGQKAATSIQGILDTLEVFSNDNDRNLILEFNFSLAPGESPASPELTPVRLAVEIQRGGNEFRLRQFRTQRTEVPPNHAHEFAQADGQWFLVRGGQRVAHVDRMFVALRPLARTVYLGAFRNAINVGGNNTYFDIQVGEQFIQAWRGFKTGTSKLQANAAYRLTDDIRHIFAFRDLEINTAQDNRTLQVFVDGRAFRLDELGSGLAQFVLVLTNVATRQDVGYILLDEPELNLHPSLQLDFLTTITAYASEGVVFGTHSIGLARAVGQQVYALKRFREGASEMRPLEGMPRLAELLGELSFSGYRELGFSRVLLVEGQADVATIQQFLRKRGRDHEIVVLPLGGSALINAGREVELTEIQRISTDVHVLMDSERHAAGEPVAADRRAFIEMCDRLHIRHHVLTRRALENYLSDRAIKRVKGGKYRALEPYEALRDVSPAWAKAENWRIAREMTLEEIDGTDLGEFVQTL